MRSNRVTDPAGRGPGPAASSAIGSGSPPPLLPAGDPGSPPAPRRPGARTTLATRIVLLVVGVAVVMAAIAGVVGTTLVRHTAAAVTRTYLAAQADVLADSYDGADPGTRIAPAKLVADLDQQGIAVATLTGTGRVNSTDRWAVTAAQRAGLATLGPGASLSTSVTVNGTALLVEGRHAGSRVFALVTPASGGTEVQQQLERRVLIALGIGLAVAVLAGLLVAALISRPLRRTAQTATAMGGGSRDLRAPVAGPREVADVAIAVNGLADALQRSESRQRSFLASVSHELRTPITAISGQAHALGDGLVAADELPEVGRLIGEESARLQRLVSDLLDLARLGADEFRLELAPCDVTALLREAGAVWRVRCQQRGASLQLELPAPPVVVVTDARRVRQVLDGLAENALRVLTPGAPLVFSLAAPAPPAPPGWVQLQVRDGGPGLADADLAVAFEPGVLHDRYRSRSSGGAGLGLGLALARSLVTRLGGSIAASPAAEGGLAITIRLPATPAPG